MNTNGPGASALTERGVEAFVALDREGRCVYANHQAECLLGKSSRELVGKVLWEVAPSLARSRLGEKCLRAIAAQEPYSFEEQCERERWWAWRLFPSPDGLSIYFEDVTDQREAEHRLRESEMRFRLLFDKNGAGMVICDADCHILQVNPAFCKLVGYTEAELLQKNALDIVHPDDREEMICRTQQMYAQQQPIENEKRYIQRDGGIVWARTSSIPFISEQGTPRCIATVQDITDSKKATEALEVSERRYRSLLLASAQIVWISDARGGILSGSSSWYALTGLTEEETQGWGWLNVVHPADQERIAHQWAEAVERKTVYENEMRVRTVGGEYRTFAVRGAPVWDDGHIREWVGTCMDITDRKRAEIDSLTWKSRYEAAIRASRQLLYDWNMSTNEVTYGGSIEAVMGYTPEEMTGGAVGKWIEHVHPDDRATFQQQVELVRRTHQPFHMEYRLRHKDGTYRIVQDDSQCYFDKRANTFRLTGFVADITDRVEMEKRLRASEERFRRIFEECGVGMLVMDLDQHILQINSAYCRFLGYTEAELLTMTERDLVYVDDLPEYDRAMSDVLAGKSRVAALDKRCVRKDGQVVWSHLTGVFPTVGGKPAYCVAVIQDITARKKAEEEVARTQRFFRSLIENSSDNITVLNSDGITLFQSPAIERQLGYKPEELVGRNNVGLIDPGDRSKATRRLRETLRRGETRAPQALRFRAKDGSWRILETVGKRFVDDTGTAVGIFNTRDVTDRVIASELLKRAKAQAEAANQAKDRFLASLSHELRTPLTPVVALLPELLQIPDLPEHVRTDLLMIKQNVELETRLIDDLLDLTRVTQGKVRLNRQKIDAHELIRTTVDIVRSDAEAKEIHIRSDLKAQESEIWGDRIRLQQALWNVLKNAIKFSPRQGCVSVETCNPETGRIRITVRDQGAGIEREQLPRIFDAFVQTLYGGGHQFGGLGLGLFISRAMIEEHGGTIEAESEGPGKGSAFHITMATIPEGAMTEPAAPVPAKAPESAPLRILLVEDHANTREVLSRLLKRQGHTVLSAESVAEALHVADENKLDIAISDLGLPDGSGLDLMPKLRSRYGIKGIAVSGYGMEGDLKRSQEAGFGAHLVKPVDFKQLQSALQQVCTPQTSPARRGTEGHS